jgi:hypothetical protein
MTKKRWWLAIGAAGLAVVATAVGLSLALTGGGGPKQLSHADYETLWGGTHLGDPKEAVLARWPKIPYQHYTDNLKDDCFEWSDEPDLRLNNMPTNLYNLCFKDGVLRTKDIL